MLEWYEAYADYEDTMERIETLVDAVAREVLGTTEVEFRGAQIDLAAPWTRVAVRRRAPRRGRLGRGRGRAPRRCSTAAASTRRTTSTWPQLVDHALSHFVEPNLIQPTILYDYPVELSPVRAARPTTTRASSSASSTSSAAWSSATPSPS